MVSPDINNDGETNIHTLNEHLNRFSIVEFPLRSNCGNWETDHVLFQCQEYVKGRLEFLQHLTILNVFQPYYIRDIMANPNCWKVAPIILKFFEKHKIKL